MIELNTHIVIIINSSKGTYMDTTKFLAQLRVIIREEIEYAINKKLVTEIAKLNSKMLNEAKNASVTTARPAATSSKVVVKPSKASVASVKKPQSTKQPSKLPSNIKDILDETRRSMRAALEEGVQFDAGIPEEDYEEMRYTTGMIPASMMDAIPPYLQNVGGEVDPDIPIAPDVQIALTRNYSELMSKLKEKTGR